MQNITLFQTYLQDLILCTTGNKKSFPVSWKALSLELKRINYRLLPGKYDPFRYYLVFNGKFADIYSVWE